MTLVYGSSGDKSWKTLIGRLSYSRKRPMVGCTPTRDKSSVSVAVCQEALNVVTKVSHEGIKNRYIENFSDQYG